MPDVLSEHAVDLRTLGIGGHFRRRHLLRRGAERYGVAERASYALVDPQVLAVLLRYREVVARALVSHRDVERRLLSTDRRELRSSASGVRTRHVHRRGASWLLMLRPHTDGLDHLVRTLHLAKEALLLRR